MADFAADKNKSRGGTLVLPFFFLRVFGALFFTFAAVSAGQLSAITAKADDPAHSTEFKGPLDFDKNGRPLVQVKINGRGPFTFLFDTAASRSVIYDNLVAVLGLETQNLKFRRVMTATGVREAPLYHLVRFEALGRTLEKLETVALPFGRDPALYGIIGVDLMRGQVFHLQRDKRTISVLNQLPQNMAAWDHIEGRYVGYGSIALQVQLDGQDVPAILDTGASTTVLNTPASSMLAKSGGATVVESKTPRIVASNGSFSGGYSQVSEMQFGTGVFRTIKLAVANLPAFTTFGARNAPAMILGMDYLDKRQLMLDMQRMDLYVQD